MSNSVLLYAANPNHVAARLGDEAIILSLEDAEYFRLNPVGTHAWNFLQEPRSLRDLTDYLYQEYDVTQSRLEQDLNRFLRSLVQANLLLLVEEAPAASGSLA